MTKTLFTAAFFPIVVLLACCLISCSRHREKQTEEQMAVSPTSDQVTDNDSVANSVTGNMTMKQISTFPNKVILTGLTDHRLVSIYKTRLKSTSKGNVLTSLYSSSGYDDWNEAAEHFMPGIDILYGYNLLNIVHYDLKSGQQNFLFSRPVFVKTLYYPSVVQDSLDKQPISRNYYLVSVYDEDTNKDTLLNKKDLRRLYHFDASGTNKTLLVPPEYSVIRSQYDHKNDIMYVFARHDENKNGSQDKSEAVHIFWFSLKAPEKAKLLY